MLVAFNAPDLRQCPLDHALQRLIPEALSSLLKHPLPPLPVCQRIVGRLRNLAPQLLRIVNIPDAREAHSQLVASMARFIVKCARNEHKCPSVSEVQLGVLGAGIELGDECNGVQPLLDLLWCWVRS